MRRRALITGINGFIGRNLEAYLSAQNLEVFGVSRNTITGKNDIRVNLANYDEVKKLMDGIRPDYVFHAAGVITASQLEDYYLTHVSGTLNLLNSVREIVRYNPKILSIGTSAEYGLMNPGDLPITEEFNEQPYDHYGISKLMQTKICLHYSKTYKLNLYVIRLFNLLGKGLSEQSAVGSFLRQIKDAQNDNFITVGNLDSSRDYMDIEDVTKIIWTISKSSVTGEIINVCSGYPIRMSNLLAMAIELSGKELFIKGDTTRFKKVDVPIGYGLNKKMMEILGSDYKFIKTADSLRKMLE